MIGFDELADTLLLCAKAIGASLTGVSVMLTVATALVSVASPTVKVKLSVALKFPTG